MSKSQLNIGPDRLRTTEKGGLKRIAAAIAVVTALVAAGCNAESAAQTPQCGQKCLYRVCQLLGVPISMPEVIGLLPPKSTGESFLEIKQALERVGLEVEGRYWDPMDAQRMQQMATPFIASMRGHFIVVDSFEKDRVRVFDGLGRRMVVARDVFSANWDGNVLLVKRPNERSVALGTKQRDPARDPIVDLDRLYTDAGDLTVETHKEARFVFHVSNRGARDLAIHEIITDCACTVAKKPSGPIKPGTSWPLEVVYRVGASRGQFERHIALTSNDPAVPQVDLFVAGNTLKKLEISHPRVDLGEIVSNEKAAQRLFVRYYGDELLALNEWRSSVAGVELRISHFTPSEKTKEIDALRTRLPFLRLPESLAEAGNTYVIDLAYTPSQVTVGDVAGQVVVKTNLQALPEVKIPLRAKVVGRVACYPRFLFLGEAREAIDTALRLETRGSESYAIDEVNLRGFRIPYSYSHGASQTFFIKFHGALDLDRKAANRSLIVRLRAVGKDVDPQTVLTVPVYLLADHKS